MDTKAEYGVDIRGEVVLLNRNIKIEGTHNSSWITGGQFVVADTMEYNSKTF